jgi:hypothetical protein
MVECKGHGVDSSEILVVEEVLLAGQPSALATEIRGQGPDNRIEDRDRRHLNSSAAFLEQLAKRVTNQGEQNDTAVCFNAGNNPIDLTACPDHAPDMLDRLRLVELHKAGSGHRMYGFASGIRDKMKMKSRHNAAKLR